MIEIDLSDHSYEDIQTFTGEHDVNLDVLSKHYQVPFVLRGSSLKFYECNQHSQIIDLVKQSFQLIEIQNRFTHQDLMYLISLADANRLKDFQAEQLLPIGKTKTGKLIYPKTLGQAEYCQALKNNEIIFATGVAGTGKTYLAVCYAVAALKRNEVKK